MPKLVKESQLNEILVNLWTRINGLSNWLGLDYVELNTRSNIFNKYDVLDNTFMAPSTGVISNDTNWCLYYGHCQAGDKFTICKREPHDSKYIMWFDANDNYLGFSTLTYPLVNGWLRYRATAPENNDIAKYAICIHKPTINLDELMIYEGHEDPPVEFIPYGQPLVNGVVIDSENVALSFNNENTNLGAITIQGAVRELDNKLTHHFLIGEYKRLAYDAGEDLEINNRVWLKCDGRAISKVDYTDLYDLLGNIFGESTDTFNLPSNQQSQGYLYICAK